jgi:hypothetical protein
MVLAEILVSPNKAANGKKAVVTLYISRNALI